MDRNQFIGFALIAVMFILYFTFFNEEPVTNTPVPATDTTVVAQRDTAPQNSVISTPDTASQSSNSASDSLLDEQLQFQYGMFAPLATGENTQVSIENDKMEVTFNSQGAKFANIQLKEFTAYYGGDLNLLEEGRSQISWKVNDNQNRTIDLKKLFYDVKSTQGDTLVIFEGKAGNSGIIEISYSLSQGSYEVDHSIKITGLQNYLGAEAQFQWEDRINHLEHDVEVSRNNANVNFYTVSEDFDETSERSISMEDEGTAEGVKWFGIKQKFFTSSIIADNQFNGGQISTHVDEADTSTVKIAKITSTYPTSDFFAAEGAGFRYYFGPNDYDILGDVAPGFGKNLYLGWPPVSYVNKWIIIPLFDLLSSFLGNYGLIIIIMVIIIKLILSPLSYKSYLSMAKMRVLKPELDEIKAKHDGDMTKVQQDQMALYRQVGVNPVSGCIPMLLQMPILFAMFYFFPQSIHLRGEGFLWATDLSTYDSIMTLPFSIPGYGDHVSLFVLLMTLSTILYTWSNNQMTTVEGPMKTISYIMPVIFLFVLNSFPAALSFYYLVSNLVTFGQQALIRKFVDEDKIKVILEQNRKQGSNKKKSKFMLKLEEAMKNGEQQKKKKK